MSRKTVDVKYVIDRTNYMLSITDSMIPVADMTPEQAFRVGVASVLESVLHETDNYHGFKYLDGHEAVQNGQYDATSVSYY